MSPTRACGLLTAFCCLFFTSCSKTAEADYQDLEWRDDVYYLNKQPFSGTAKATFPNGKPKGLYELQSGRFHGTVQEWWDNGQLSTETHFDKGQRHGLNRYWTREGKLMKEQVYDHDRSISEKHY